MCGLLQCAFNIIIEICAITYPAILKKQYFHTQLYTV